MSDFVTWAEANFWVPDAARSGRRRRAGTIVLTDVQKRVLSHVFTPDAEGLMPYDTIVYSTTKKEGKTTIGAAVCQWWALTQEPPNEIYIVSNKVDQAKDRVYRALTRSVRLNPALRNLTKIAEERIQFSNETIIQALASNPYSVAGSNHGLVQFDELWSYVSEGFRLLYDELTQVPTRQNSVHFITTYAGFERQSELLWELYIQGVGQAEHPQGQGEPIPGLEDLPCYRNGRLFVYWDHENRAPWKTARWMAEQKRKFRGRPSAWLRFYENKWSSSEETFIDPQTWDACIDNAARPMLPNKSTPIFIGLDASTKRDTTALVATWYEAFPTIAPPKDRTSPPSTLGRVHLAFYKIWQPEPGEDFDLDATVGAELLDIQKRYSLRYVMADPTHLHQSRIKLKTQGLIIEEFPQTVPNITRASQQLFDLLSGKNLVMFPSDELRSQMLSTIAVQIPRGWKIDKAKSSQKIDAIVALGISCLAAVEHGAYETGEPAVVEMPFPELAQAGRDDPRLADLPIQLGGRKVVDQTPLRRIMIYATAAPDLFDLAVAKLGGQMLTDGREQGYLQAAGGYLVEVTGNERFLFDKILKSGMGQLIAGPFELPEEVSPLGWIRSQDLERDSLFSSEKHPTVGVQKFDDPAGVLAK